MAKLEGLGRCLSGGIAAMLIACSVAKAEEGTIKIGILHSLSGTMAISETTLKDAMLILIEDTPVVAFSMGEEELAGFDTPTNAEFIKTWRAFTKNGKRVTNDPMEAHYIGFDFARELADLDKSDVRRHLLL